MARAALTVEQVSIDRLVPYARNPRRNAGAVAKVAASLREFGWRQPIVVDREMTVIAGHTRLEAARQLGMTEVPVHVADDLTAARAKAYRLADNRTAEEAEWDADLLRLEFEDLAAAEFDLALTGFDADEINDFRLEAPAGLGDPEDVPDAPIAESKSKLGAVYELGPHRLVCGDSRSSDVWLALLGGAQLDMLWTDPPYGVAYQANLSPEEAKRLHRRSDGLEVANDALVGDDLAVLLRASLGHALRSARPGAAWYVAGPGGEHHLVFAEILRELGVWRQTIQWVKDVFAFGRSDYHYRHEPIFYGWKPGAAHYFVDDRTQDTVWEIARPRRSEEHPTMKPVALVQRAIENSSKAGWLVVDPFGGSGTTMIAAELTGRRAALIELDPRYCDVIRKRYAEFVGRPELVP